MRLILDLYDFILKGQNIQSFLAIFTALRLVFLEEPITGEKRDLDNLSIQMNELSSKDQETGSVGSVVMDAGKASLVTG